MKKGENKDPSIEMVTEIALLIYVRERNPVYFVEYW